jgi:hypothetical protein
MEVLRARAITPPLRGEKKGLREQINFQNNAKKERISDV